VELLLFLILFPALMGFIFLVFPNNRARDAMVALAALVLIAATVILFIQNYGAGTVIYEIEPGAVSMAMMALEVVLALGVLYLAVKYRQWIVGALTIIGTGVVLFAETLFTGPEHLNNLFVDEFTLIMAMIIGVIGSLICIFATGYMRDYHDHHKEIKDKRRGFFFLLFIFLSAMFGVVFSNNMFWLYFFWEITTLCSFLLIGYAWDEEAQKNAFWALLLNLLGGLGFGGTFLYLAFTEPSGGLIMLDSLIAAGPAIAMIPAALIGFAGLAKAAQMPFSSWLLGAMIAPTPVSALLHSSTMVKAGVYVIVRFAPIYDASFVGFLIALVGGFTFLLASSIAISQSNAKRVLAWSTIANLGLIVTCAGIGNAAAVWAAILLIVFHAIAKSLLFLCTGTVEHRIGSRDIEDMGGLVSILPKITIMMIIGIAGMFLAPFGMLISKWAALRAFLETPYGIFAVILIAFGSAATLFFWTKWMGKLLQVAWKPKPRREGEVSKPEFYSLLALAAGVVIICLGFPLLSSVVVEPFLIGIYGIGASLGEQNIAIMLMMMVVVFILPLSLIFFRRDRRVIPHYVGGRAATMDMEFAGSMGVQRKVELSNYYFDGIFGEAKLGKAGNILCTLFIACIGVVLAMGVIV